MKFMDRLSRLLGRHPDSLKTEADRPRYQSEPIAASDIEIHAADNASSRHKGASGSSDENFVQPQPPNLVALHDAPHSGKIMSSGGVSPIDLGHAGSVTSQCHSVVTNKRVTYATDAEMAAALGDLNRQITGTTARIAVVRIQSSKGL